MSRKDDAIRIGMKQDELMVARFFAQAAAVTLVAMGAVAVGSYLIQDKPIEPSKPAAKITISAKSTNG